MENLKKQGDGIICPMAVIVRDGKLLLGLRNYTPDKWKEISVWTVPGGRSEEGETIGETLIREAAEEVGITDLEIKGFLGEIPGAKPPDIVLYFKCNTSQEPKLMEPEKFSEWKWFGIDEIPENFVNPNALEILKSQMLYKIFMNEKDITDLIKKDEWMMKILNAAKSLNLPDWWIGAGFVRGKVWDTLHNYSARTPTTDIDFIYFDPKDFSEEEAGNESTRQEKIYEQKLGELMPGVNWSVTNQARMHVYHNTKPYRSSSEALGDWVETATCVGVKVDDKDELILTAPHGIDDLVNLILRPTTKTERNLKEFDRRISSKKWLTKWPKLKVVKD